MPNAAKAAEWILSLVTTQERASATIGDCLEATRGAVSFWWFILRTTFSICIRDAWQARWAFLLLLLYGVVVEGLLSAVLLLVPEMLRISIRVIRTGTDDGLHTSWWWVAVVVTVIVPFLGGRLVAKRSGGREIAAALTLAIVPGTIGLIITTALALLAHRTPPFDLPVSYNALFILAGALSWRARHPRPV